MNSAHLCDELRERDDLVEVLFCEELLDRLKGFFDFVLFLCETLLDIDGFPEECE